MPITAILIDANGPVIPGMKTLDDFIISNWFIGLPDTGAVPFSGFYFGDPVTDITYNSYDKNTPAVVHGSLNNASGYIQVNTTDYLDTMKKAPLTLTVCGVAKRAATSDINIHFVADFSGSGANSFGFTIGFAGNGQQLFMAAQNTGVTTASYAYVTFPGSVGIGDVFTFTASISPGSLTIDIYNPVTSTMVSGAVTLPGTRVAGTNNVLLGRKTDNNVETTTKNIKSVLLMDGVLTSAEKISVSQFLLSMP